MSRHREAQRGRSMRWRERRGTRRMAHAYRGSLVMLDPGDGLHAVRWRQRRRAARSRERSRQRPIAPGRRGACATTTGASRHSTRIVRSIAPDAGDSAGGTLVLARFALRDAAAAAGGGHRDLAVGRPVVLRRELPNECTRSTSSARRTAGWRRRATWPAPIRSRPDISPLFDRPARASAAAHRPGWRAEVLADQIRAEHADRGLRGRRDVTLSAYVDMVHVWHLMRDATPDGQRAIDEAGAFARAHVA